ncbi:hypothetical protein Terro_3305 [Terriglobus roseus DSM 18391]|uniref:DUF305 domain-containing protein n=1 Tax=Terriglobus roseus (strain DSM 18391 / NRRL B-41598 / KBS 63) TaxID=926566 RepID=I3ZJV4_TERRK|nr:DUF305 domain-containing protein [Terriglobus roseus]AFL89522.1 hypothetical protein Terro_3305 [Terriglobus roseus DSM 18391]
MASRFFRLCLAALCLSASSAFAQQAPVIVQPGAPGQPSKTLTEVTAVSVARPLSEADIRFMQDMIMHHGQAVEMTALLKTRTSNPELQELGRKIDVSQSDEIRWMKQWLAERGIAPETLESMPGMDHTQMSGMDHGSMAGMDHSAMDHAHMDHSQMAGMATAPKAAEAAKSDPMDVAMMPGMLTPRQMATLRRSNGEAFDRLFLTGMIQHHSGALLMVKQLFDSPGAGQDPQLFDFANDVDNTQLAEIDIMKGILRKVNP